MTREKNKTIAVFTGNCTSSEYRSLQYMIRGLGYDSDSHPRDIPFPLPKYILLNVETKEFESWDVIDPGDWAYHITESADPAKLVEILIYPPAVPNNLQFKEYEAIINEVGEMVYLSDEYENEFELTFSEINTLNDAIMNRVEEKKVIVAKFRYQKDPDEAYTATNRQVQVISIDSSGLAGLDFGDDKKYKCFRWDRISRFELEIEGS